MLAKVKSLSVMKLTDFIGILLIAGTVLLIYWPTVYRQGNFFPVRFELVFFVAIILFSWLMFAQYRAKTLSIEQSEKKLLKALLLLIISLTVATTYSYIAHKLTFNFLGIAVLLKVSLGVGVCAAICFLTKKNTGLYKAISWAFIIPSCLLIPFLLVPHIAESIGFLSSGYRFQGPTSNPAMFCFLAIISFCLLYSFALNAWHKKDRIMAIIYILLMMGVSALILWSQFRSYTIALFLGTALITIFHRTSLKLSLDKIFGYFIASSIFVSLSFFLIPRISQELFIYTRLFGVHGDKIEEKFRNKTNEKYELSITSARSSMANDPRITMWEYYIPVLLKHPLGLGVNYQPTLAYKWTYDEKDHYLPPFFFFNVWALGGLLGLYSIFYLSRATLKRIQQEVIHSSALIHYKIPLFVAFTICWFVSLFSGIPVDFIPFWVLLGLLLAQD